MRQDIIVTIDGPAGAGKTTTARAVAAKLGFRYMDTGAMYRGIAVAVSGMDDLGCLDWFSFLSKLQINFCFTPNQTKVLLDGRDITAFLREPHIAMLASTISAHPKVREYLTKMQRDTALYTGGFVLEGRDTGTAVIPEAKFKFYLDADPAVRAKRRQVEMEAQGKIVNYQELLAAIRSRDKQDSNREVAPLRVPHDAIVIFTDSRPVIDVVEQITNAVHTDLFGRTSFSKQQENRKPFSL